jgi:exoenzyme U
MLDTLSDPQLDWTREFTGIDTRAGARSSGTAAGGEPVANGAEANRPPSVNGAAPGGAPAVDAAALNGTAPNGTAPGGASIAAASAAPGGGPAPAPPPVSQAPSVTALTPPPPGGGATMPMLDKPPSGLPICPVDAPVQSFASAGGRQILVAKNAAGGVSYTAPPPPIRELTFSGGGAKGAALPGAIKALEDSGILKDTKKISGASVGSMTAALVASGMTAKEFAEVANDKMTNDIIIEGTDGSKLDMLFAAINNKGNPLTGQGLEAIVKMVVDASLRKRIYDYLKPFGPAQTGADPTVIKIMHRLGGDRQGATFMEMRELSKVIPAIKEVVITGTYTTEYTDDGKGKGGLKQMKGGDGQGKLYVFDADSEPEMAVSLAVHASASFPGAFKPVNIKISSGLTVRFIDGGVMNNTPTSSSLSNDLDLDPIPDKRGLTFMFEDKKGIAEGVAKGQVKASQGYGSRAMDWVLSAKYNAGEYSKNREAAEHKDEVVVVPLTVTLPPKKKGEKGQQIDMRDGTLNFSLPNDAKLALQAKTEEATNKRIKETGQPKTMDFASDSQMFMCVPVGDLKAMADGDMKGAKAAMEFRGVVAGIIGDLKNAVRAGGDPSANDKVKQAFAELERRSADDPEYRGYVARELNKAGIGSTLGKLRAAPGPKSDMVKAACEVADAVKVHAYAINVLRNVIYPQMTMESEGGRDATTLSAMETMLRKAKTPKDYNGALSVGIKAFKGEWKMPVLSRDHNQFARTLQGWLMKETT